MTAEEGDRLSRWSRMKLATADPAPDAALAAEPDAQPDAAPAPPEIVEGEIPEAELLEQLGLPDPDTMAQGDDFSAFMPKSVPDFLRRRALRRLWLSNPVLANIDGLVDYGDDFTDAAMAPAVLNTIYEVGRGMVSRVEKALEEIGDLDRDAPAVADAAETPETEAETEAEAEAETAPQAPPALTDSPEAPFDPAFAVPSSEIVHRASDPAPVQTLLKPRRMRFEPT